jgi:hypothetical protein
MSRFESLKRAREHISNCVTISRDQCIPVLHGKRLPDKGLAYCIQKRIQDTVVRPESSGRRSDRKSLYSVPGFAIRIPYFLIF